jgi:hypothetical protein
MYIFVYVKIVCIIGNYYLKNKLMIKYFSILLVYFIKSVV